jgi:MerR family transcriptional regulator, light-induced transcriptional regulator
MQGGSTPGAAHADCPSDVAQWRASLPAVAPEQQRSDAMSTAERVAHLARTLEREVIPRLAASHRAGPHAGNHADASNDAHMPKVAQSEIEAFTAQVVAGNEVQLAATVAALRARGASLETVFMALLAPTARHFGDLWTDDRCDFATVTAGLGRLQRLMRELSPAFGTEVAHPPCGRRALLVRAPGEQHSFGLSMVAEFFRRAGWEVAAGGADADIDPISAVRREWFDVAGFSVGGEARLGWLPGCIAAVRQASRNRALRVLVGGPVLSVRPDLASQVGADAWVPDGSAAPSLAESLLAGRVKRS